MLRFKKISSIILIFFLLIGVVLTLFLVKQNQESRSRASASTTLRFNEAFIQKNVNDTFPLDILLTPGSNTPFSATLEIKFDPTKLTIADNGFSASGASAITSGPTLSNGKITVSINLGNASISGEAKVATVIFKAVSTTQSPTIVEFGTGTTVSSSTTASESASTNTLSSSVPTSVSISEPTPIAAVFPTPTTVPQQPISITPTLAPTPGISLSSITGLVYEDTNRNGTKDENERIFDSSAIRVVGGPNNIVNGTIYTKGTGRYSIENLPAGQYTVTAVTPANFTPSTPATLKITTPQNGDINFGFGQLTTQFYLERFPWSNLNVSSVSPSKIYVLLRFRSGFSADILSSQGNYNYVWGSTDTSIATLSPFAECTNGILPPCPNDHLTITGHKAGPVIIRLSVVDKTTNLEIANTYFIVTVVAPTVGPTPTPFIPTFPITVFLHAIGKAGDSVSTSSADSNKNPLVKTRKLNVELYNNLSQSVVKTTGTVTYNASSGGFTGSIPLTSALSSGSYTIKVKTEQHLRKTLSGIFIVPSLQYLPPPPVTLIAGDVNNDNKINLLDYNLIIDCYSDAAPTHSCNQEKKQKADINDDGNVNLIDLNIFLRNLSDQSGE